MFGVGATVKKNLGTDAEAKVQIVIPLPNGGQLPAAVDPEYAFILAQQLMQAAAESEIMAALFRQAVADNPEDHLNVRIQAAERTLQKFSEHRAEEQRKAELRARKVVQIATPGETAAVGRVH